MKRDLLIIGGGMLAVSAILWAVWGNPKNMPRIHTVQQMKAANELKLVSGRSPYMRAER
jgi:hypothetical protein